MKASSSVITLLGRPVFDCEYFLSPYSPVELALPPVFFKGMTASRWVYYGMFPSFSCTASVPSPHLGDLSVPHQSVFPRVICVAPTALRGVFFCDVF